MLLGETPTPSGRTAEMLLDRARGRREYCVGVGTDQADRTNDNNEDHCQHNRILGDILGFVLTRNTFQRRLIIFHLLSAQYARRKLQTSVRRGGDSKNKRSGSRAKRLAFTPNAPRIVHLWYQLVKQTTVSNPREARWTRLLTRPEVAVR